MKTTHRKRNWNAIQRAFLEKIAPDFIEFLMVCQEFISLRRTSGEKLCFVVRTFSANHGLASVGEMIGKTDHELTPGPFAVKYLSDGEEIYRTGLPLLPNIKICMDHLGMPAWYRTCKYPIKDRNGQLIGIMGTFQEVADPKTNSLETEILSIATRLLEENLVAFPSVKVLSEVTQTGVRSLQRNFQAIYRMRPKTYWMKLGIRKACELIASGTLALTQISSELGFFDQGNLTKHFKSHAGMTPKAYSQLYAHNRYAEKPL